MVRTVPLRDHDAPESFELSRQWQAECLSKHSECGSTKRVRLPTRLVRVSPLGVPESARICKTSGRRGRYCALSYCWGPPSSQPLATKQKNYSSYLERLLYANLPKTILDAFQVTRNLGLSYIWIDSLCIMQDDLGDTQEELGKILHIYRNAQFTISAASASNCNQGFLKVSIAQAQEYNEVAPFFLPLRVDENTMGSILVSNGDTEWYKIRNNEQNINQRAWTLQEVLLAPRLLIFTDLHMVWRCQRGFRRTPLPPTRPEDVSRSMLRALEYEMKYVNLDSLDMSPWRATVHHAWGYTCAPIKEIESSPAPDETYLPDDPRFSDLSLRPLGIWRSILQNYTKRELTMETDKLVAVSAIAEVFSPHLGGHYLAGLWRRSLIHDLLWRADGEKSNDLKVSNSGSPSWSWAAVRGKIQTEPPRYLSHSVNTTADIIDCSVTLQSHKAPFGAVKGGELIVLGYLKEMQLNHNNLLLRQDETGRRISVDYISDGYQYSTDYMEAFFGVRKSTQVWCLTLGNALDSDDENFLYCQGILLIASHKHPGCYQRFGFIKDDDIQPVWWEQCEKTRVKIV